MEARMMKVYTNKEFNGLWPVPGTAVVAAEDADQAAKILNDELRSRHLAGDAKPADMKEFNTDAAGVVVLCDGNY